MSTPPNPSPSHLLPTRKQGRHEWIFALGAMMGILWALNLSVSSASPADINHNPPFRAMLVAVKHFRKVQDKIWLPAEKVYVAQLSGFRKKLHTCFEAGEPDKPQMAEAGLLDNSCLTNASLTRSVKKSAPTRRKHRRSHRRHYHWR